jgi:hypothetical protein
MAGDCVAEVKVTAELSQDGSSFRFENVPLPAIDDAGSKGKWKVVAGQVDAKHDASYRTSANFIDWVIRNHPNDGRFLEKLNEAAREGRYSGETWKELTGMTEQELADAWREGRQDDR